MDRLNFFGYLDTKEISKIIYYKKDKQKTSKF